MNEKKEFSGRKFITVVIISTYCFTIISSIFLVVGKLLTIEAFLALLSGFGTLAMYITKAYYDDKDRKQQNGITNEGGQK